MSQSTAGGVPSIIRAGSYDRDAAKEMQDVTCNGNETILSGTADAIPFPGVVQLNSAGADACTLATPIAGAQPIGDDGKTCIVYDNSGQAHTITTAANKIVNSKHVLTFNGTKGSNVYLMAQNGIWLVIGTANGVAVS